MFHFDIERLNLERTIIGSNGEKAYKLGGAGERYAAWRQMAAERGLCPCEHLLPRILCHCPEDPPPLFSSGKTSEQVSDRALRKAMEQLGPWSFPIKLRDGIETADNTVARNRLYCRSHLITNTVAALLGEHIRETRFLDMGCHLGFFSLDIAQRGAAQVTGIDLRSSNIAQAVFLADYFGLTRRVSFEVADIMAYEPEQPVDVVYNLGLLYHVSDPIALLRKTYHCCTRFAVIDTICHAEPISAYIAVFNKNTAHDAEGKDTVELHPTYRALIDTMYDAGFQQLLEITPHSGRIAGIYANHRRRCIIGFKESIPGLNL